MEVTIKYETNLLEDFMQKHNMSLVQFAKFCDVSVGTLKRIFNMKNIRLKTLIKICEATNISADDLLKRNMF